jgi:hypothetical protein
MVRRLPSPYRLPSAPADARLRGAAYDGPSFAFVLTVGVVLWCIIHAFTGTTTTPGGDIGGAPAARHHGR